MQPGDGAERVATLTCDGDTGSGSAWLADGATAAAACAEVRDGTERLTDGPDEDAFCTQQYGGDDTARVQGMVDGESVDTMFSLRNGCEIADWEMFDTVLGPREGGPRPLTGS